MYLFGIVPVKHKFRNQLARESLVDICQFEHVEDVATRLPIWWDRTRCRIVGNAISIYIPLSFYMAEKLTVPCGRRVATFAPVQFEFRYAITEKCQRNLILFRQNFDGLFAWLPVRVDGLVFGGLSGILLVVSPFSADLGCEFAAPS